MDKLKMAHDCALAYIKYGDGKTHYKDVVEFAWQYADAMQAEADKREPSGLPEALCEVDWRFAPLSAHAWQMVEGHAVWINSHGPMGNAPTFGFTGSHIVERPDVF